MDTDKTETKFFVLSVCIRGPKCFSTAASSRHNIAGHSSAAQPNRRPHKDVAPNIRRAMPTELQQGRNSLQPRHIRDRGTAAHRPYIPAQEAPRKPARERALQ